MIFIGLCKKCGRVYDTPKQLKAHWEECRKDKGNLYVTRADAISKKAHPKVTPLHKRIV